MIHYDDIGQGYRNYRLPDVRIQRQLNRAWAPAHTLLNIGAGTGSYEPDFCDVVSLDFSRVMLRQRSSRSAPSVCGRAEQLPFDDASFDVATGILTIHHWQDAAAGLREACRVARKVVLLTWVGFPDGFWLDNYVPEVQEADLTLFPTVAELEQILGPIEVEVVPIPHDCTDGFLCAYWRRPHAYLDAGVRSAISTFARIGDVSAPMAQLRQDLDNGQWQQRFGELQELPSKDYGYRLVSTAH